MSDWFEAFTEPIDPKLAEALLSPEERAEFARRVQEIADRLLGEGD